MNSNLFLCLMALCFVSCGVKGDPVIPQNNPLPSVIENYPDIKVDKDLNEAKKP